MILSRYDLPAHWASALVNDDRTGLDDADERELDAFLRGEGLSSCSVVVEDSEPEFRRYRDAQPYGVLACDCLSFAFLQ